MNQTSFPPPGGSQKCRDLGGGSPPPLTMKAQKPDKEGERSEHNTSKNIVAESSMHCSATDSRTVVVAQEDSKIRKVTLKNDATEDDELPDLGTDSEDEVPPIIIGNDKKVSLN